ncbi:hypothetical protein RF11_07786 [Thelohanellus kitauei]|uniref:Uncharacterized protein n=1 Tax=Thelohanellus kitauei TaxID=669202 RepID=A0A0C2JY47_THEKT|nr:hypothetical protein RF11_07786 [Thelohanellus kitauei]
MKVAKMIIMERSETIKSTDISYYYSLSCKDIRVDSSHYSVYSQNTILSDENIKRIRNNKKDVNLIENNKIFDELSPSKNEQILSAQSPANFDDARRAFNSIYFNNSDIDYNIRATENEYDYV